MSLALITPDSHSLMSGGYIPFRRGQPESFLG